MPEFEIEMLWDCRFCKQKLNRGLQRHCRNCGHPKDDLDREYMPTHVSLRDALLGDKEALAKAGVDWKCKHCGSLQNPLHKCCTDCGVPQGQGAKPWDVRTVAATFDPITGVQTSATEVNDHVDTSSAVDPWKEAAETAEGTTPTPAPAILNEPLARTSTSAPSSRRSESMPVDSDASVPSFGLPRRTKRAIVIAPCVALLGLLLFLLFRTSGT
jgi:hypothetical protein